MNPQPYYQSEYLGDIAADLGLAAKTAIVLRGRKPEVAARRLHGERQMTKAILDIDARIEQRRAIAAEADALGSGALQLKHAIFTGAAAEPGIVIRFNPRNAKRKPGGHALGGRHGLDQRDHIAAPPRCREAMRMMAGDGITLPLAGIFHGFGSASDGVGFLSAGKGRRPGDVSGGFDPCRSFAYRMLGGTVGRKWAVSAISAGSHGRYCESRAKYNAGNDPCNQCLLHVFPFIISVHVRDELQNYGIHSDTTTDILVRIVPKQSDCVLNVGEALQLSIGSMLLRKNHEGLGGPAAKGYKAKS